MKKQSFEGFGRVWGASGVQNFDKSGWWYHQFLRFIGLVFWGVTFVSKTTTLRPRLDPSKREGNMPLKDDGITPKEKFPKCIHITFWMWIRGMVLNAVGLSGPGAKALLEKGIWHKMKGPIVLSFMSVAQKREERLEELRQFLRMLRLELPKFNAKKIALQINYSCPNTGHDLKELAGEVCEGLDMAWDLRIPIMPKFNVQMPIEDAFNISHHSGCAGICISNTIPFGKVLPPAWWEKYFGTADPAKSPLAEFGGGGLSGKPLRSLVEKWVRDARSYGISCHINAGGGVLGPIGAIRLFLAGADSIFLGSIAMLRPWMMLPTIWVGKFVGWFMHV
ncbi:MAG: hypothetical protein V4438_04130 [Patescibacteria group bacterium]